jgi:hypothetical protein
MAESDNSEVGPPQSRTTDHKYFSLVTISWYSIFKTMTELDYSLVQSRTTAIFFYSLESILSSFDTIRLCK